MPSPAAIPQCDPGAAYRAHAADIDRAIAGVLARGHYVLGPEVQAFEQAFATWLGCTHALGVGNGTDALAIALRALGIGPGDGVVTVAHTAVATVSAIRSVGAMPLFVDVDAQRGLIDAGQVEALLDAAKRGILSVRRESIRAIVPVHLYGACADMPAIMAIAHQHGLKVVEDCAQAHGATIGDRKAGTFGDVAAFSFYPTKNLGAIGDGGAIATPDPALHERARLLRQYGWRERYVSDIEGGNSRLDELQAAILNVKLPWLEADNAARAAIAARYLSGIRHPALALALPATDGIHAWHQFTLRCAHRDGLRGHLQRQGIGSLVHYPVPVHRQPAYADPAFAPMPLPETERWAEEVLSLPMFPQLSSADCDRVVACINAWAGD